jgi:hypothetical protein
MEYGMWLECLMLNSRRSLATINLKVMSLMSSGGIYIQRNTAHTTAEGSRAYDRQDLLPRFTRPGIELKTVKDESTSDDNMDG